MPHRGYQLKGGRPLPYLVIPSSSWVRSRRRRGWSIREAPSSLTLGNHGDWTQWYPIIRLVQMDATLTYWGANITRLVPVHSINNNSALVQIMAWCRIGDKPLLERIQCPPPPPPSPQHTQTQQQHNIASSRATIEMVNSIFTEIILSMCPANGRRRYTVTPSHNGWAHTQNDPYIC